MIKILDRKPGSGCWQYIFGTTEEAAQRTTRLTARLIHMADQIGLPINVWAYQHTEIVGDDGVLTIRYSGRRVTGCSMRSHRGDPLGSRTLGQAATWISTQPNRLRTGEPAGA